MFLNFISTKGVSVRIYGKFPREEEEADAKKVKKWAINTQIKKMQMMIKDQIQSRIRDLMENPSGIAVLNTELAQLKESQRIRRLGNITDTNYVADNVYTIDQYSANQRKEEVQ